MLTPAEPQTGFAFYRENHPHCKKYCKNTDNYAGQCQGKGGWRSALGQILVSDQNKGASEEMLDERWKRYPVTFPLPAPPLGHLTSLLQAIQLPRLQNNVIALQTVWKINPTNHRSFGNTLALGVPKTLGRKERIKSPEHHGSASVESCMGKLLWRVNLVTAVLLRNSPNKGYLVSQHSCRRFKLLFWMLLVHNQAGPTRKKASFYLPKM